MESVDAVIVGGGCIGASTLYHLAALGCRSAVLLERESLAAGATSKAAGGIRLQHTEEINVRIAQRSLDEFTAFAELTGVPIDFQQHGYLLVFSDEDDAVTFTGAAAMQRRLGVPTEVLGVDRIQELVPGLTRDDLHSATYCALEGYASPEAVVQGYASAARALGAGVRVGCEVSTIVTEGGRVTGVETSAGRIATDVVVIAAGLGSPNLAAAVGLDLPVVGLPRTIYFSGESAGVPNGAPLVVDFAAGFYFHREGPGLLFAGVQSDLAELSEPAAHRLPAIAEVEISSSWWGSYDMSPDHMAMVGAADVEGLFYATGFSGHGFMQSPAVGEYLAQRIVGVDPTLDLGFLTAGRLTGATQPLERYVV